MSYTSPRTGQTYPSYLWMIANIDNLPEVQKEYPEIVAANKKAMGTKVSTDSTLKGTLPVEQPVAGKELPQTNTGGSLAAFENVFKQVVNKAAQEAQSKGLDVMKGRTTGLNMPGSSLSGIMDIVNQQATGGFKDIYTSTVDYMQEQQNKNWQQLQLVISQNALPQFDDESISTLAKMNNIDPSFLLGIKSAQQAELDRQAAGTSTENYRTQVLAVQLGLEQIKNKRDEFIKEFTENWKKGISRFNLFGIGTMIDVNPGKTYESALNEALIEAGYDDNTILQWVLANGVLPKDVGFKLEEK